jgi:hypothetical protein
MEWNKKEPRKPQPWLSMRMGVRHRWLIPFHFVDWLSQWAAYYLGQWVFLEVLEYCGTLSILVGVILYFAEAGDRREQRHFQAWQVINTAQGKGGSGGRIEALHDLNEDRVPLVGVDLSDAFLQNVDLPGANLHRCRMSSADVRQAKLRRADLTDSELFYVNLRNSDLRGALLGGDTNLTNADLMYADLSGADVGGTTFDETDLRDVKLDGLRSWLQIKSMRLANIAGVVNPPDGFIDWAKQHGAVEMASDDEWTRAIDAADNPATQPSASSRPAKPNWPIASTLPAASRAPTK